MRYLRFHDLVARGILNNRTTLSRWIKRYGFPPGILIGPNTRAWDAVEVERWLAERSASAAPKAA
jgi:predicted DNA-binding transcriptional regulator AlpA